MNIIVSDRASPPPPKQRFSLLRRLFFGSLLATIATSSLLIFLYRGDQISEHEILAAEENEKAVANLVHELNGQFKDLIANSKKLGIKALIAKSPPFKLIISSALVQRGASDVLKVKIYSPEGMTIYSPDTDEIGRGSKNTVLLTDALHGAIRHTIQHRDEFVGINGKLHDIDVAATYMPLLYAGKQIGVVEVYSDVTPLFKRVRFNSYKIAIITAGIFATLFALLSFVLSKTDRAIIEWQDTVSEKEQDLRESQSIAGLGSYVLDLTTGKWESSELLNVLFGINKSYDRTIDGWTALVHPDDRTMMADYLGKEVLEQGDPFDKEYRIIRQDDRAERWVHGLGRLEFNTANFPVRLRGTVMDITERKRAELDLRIAAAAFEAHDAIIITDADANIIKVNEAFTTLSGYSRDEVLGKNPRIMSSGLHDKAFFVELFNKIHRDDSWTGEIWDKRKNGEIYPRSMTITAVKNERDILTNYVGIFSDVTERKRNEELLNRLAFYDALTQLPNRRLLDDRLEQAITACKRSGHFGAVIFLDLDNFKPLNDAYGHKTGDLLLVEVAHRLAGCVREMDTVARLGGDEFVVLLTDLSSVEAECIEQSRIIAEKIRAALSEPYWLTSSFLGTTHNIRVHNNLGASIGVALFNPDLSAEKVLKYADKAMYAAKEDGRNSIRFYEPQM